MLQGLEEITPLSGVDRLVRWQRLGEPLPEGVEKRLRFVGRAGDDREQQEGDLVFTRCAFRALERANFLAGGSPRAQQAIGVDKTLHRARRAKQRPELVEYSGTFEYILNSEKINTFLVNFAKGDLLAWD
ncbi:MAG: hypothetical protein DKINENOH_05398 [bacterium]|nr:hypothetical protein [bacterium]